MGWPEITKGLPKKCVNKCLNSILRMSEDPGILGSETQVIDTRILSQASFFLLEQEKV